VPPVALLPLAVVAPTVKVVVPPVALLPLAGVMPRHRAAHRRCVPPVAVVVRPSKSLYCVVCTYLQGVDYAIQVKAYNPLFRMVARIFWYKNAQVGNLILSLLRLYLVFFRTFI
jgi:hypothetical protein